MLNSLIPYILSIHSFNKIDSRGKQRSGVRLIVCSLDDSDLMKLSDFDTIIKYCRDNNRSIDCYECLDKSLNNIVDFGDSYNDLSIYRLHRLKTLDRINEILSLSGDSGLLCYNNKPYCKFVPSIKGDFTINGDLLCYNGEKKMFILPNDNYRHVDVVFYNKVFINIVTGDIIGRYAGLDENKQFIETEERWDESQGIWIVTKKRITEIAGCKVYS